MSQQSHAKATVGVAALLAFSFYVPAYFQYEVVEVKPCKSDIMDNIDGTDVCTSIFFGQNAIQSWISNLTNQLFHRTLPWPTSTG